MKLIHAVLPLICAVVLSSRAFAAMPDFEMLAAFEDMPGQQEPGHPGHQQPGHPGQQQPGHPGHGGPGHQMHMCMVQGWKAAKTSEDQNTQARAFMQKAKAVFEAHKDGIKAGMESMKAAWRKHPISKDEVAKAGAGLHEHVAPVMTAGREAHIDIIDLLSPEQRKAFDHGFMHCMHHGQ